MKTMTFYTPDDNLGLYVLVGMLLALPREASTTTTTCTAR